MEAPGKTAAHAAIVTGINVEGPAVKQEEPSANDILKAKIKELAKILQGREGSPKESDIKNVFNSTLRGYPNYTELYRHQNKSG